MKIAMRSLFASIALIAIIYIFWQHEQASRYAKPDVITVVPVINDRSFMFSHDEVWNASAVFDGHIEMEHHSIRRFDVGGRFAFAHVSTVGQRYFDVAVLPFTSGSYWMHDGDMSIIVSELLAWELFGSMDVVGLYVRVYESYYKITGVVQDAVEPHVQADGFAWIPRNQPDAQVYYGAILHFIPDSYNLVHTNMDVLRILALLNRRAGDYVIIDINSYVASIVLRGQLLLSLAGLVFTFFLLRVIFRTWQKRLDYEFLQGNKRWAWAFGTVLALALFFALLAPHIPVDFWLPSFFPDGLAGYSRMFFNAGLYVPRQYLPNYLVALFDLNVRANWAFIIGLSSLVGWMASQITFPTHKY